jgi:hypothetical protein
MCRGAGCFLEKVPQESTRMEETKSLFTPVEFGPLKLKHRVVMAP